MRPGAEQGGSPGWPARRRRVPARRGGRRRRNLPAHPRRRQIARRIEPHQPQRRPVPLCRQAEPARGGEAERPRVTRQLAQHESQITTAQTLFQRKQRIFTAARRNMDQPGAQRRRQTRTVGPARAAECGLVLHPQERTLILPRLIERQRQRQSRAAGIVSGREQFGMPGFLPNPGKWQPERLTQGAIVLTPAFAGSPGRQPPPPSCRWSPSPSRGGCLGCLPGQCESPLCSLYVHFCSNSQFPSRPNRPNERAARTRRTAHLKTRRTGQSLTSIPPGSGGTGCWGASLSPSCTSTIPRPTWLLRKP